MKHKFLKNHKVMYVNGTEMRECSCGVWREYDKWLEESLVCYNIGERKQTTSEALAQLNQSVRNLGYALKMVLKLDN